MATNRVEVSRELEDIMPMFLDTITRNIESIRSSGASGDLETIRSLGHRMKGAGGGYGLDRVTELGRKIEEAAKAGNVAAALQSTEELAEYMKNTEIVFVNRPL